MEDKIIIRELISLMSVSGSVDYLNELLKDNILWMFSDVYGNNSKKLKILEVKYWPNYSKKGGMEFIFERNSEPIHQGAVMQCGTASIIIDEDTDKVVYYKKRKKIISIDDPYGEEDWNTDESMKYLRRFEHFNEAIIKWHDKGELGDEEEIDDELLKKEYKFKVVIGDWSDDGHGESEEFVFKGNYPVETLRQSYKDSCKLTGVQFNHNQDYTGIEVDKNLPYQKKWDEENKRRICTEYGNNFIDIFAHNKLKEFGLKVEGFDEAIDIDQFVELILNFIKLSLPDFQYEEASYKRSELKEIPPLNGYWNKGLNVQFGYGLYE